MLVVASDLHLTDGTCAPTLPAASLRVLVERIQDLALRAAWRTDGRYRPLPQIDLLLLGDVLDVTRSTRWLAGTARPWDNIDSPAFADAVTGITGEILRASGETTAILRSLAEGAIRLPLASLHGQPVTHVELQPVPVRIHYMVGNHDWYLRLPGPRFDSLRRLAAQHLGLAMRPETPFPHAPHEHAELNEMLREHRVLARHGDLFDPLACSDDRNGASIGDALTIDLVTKFLVQIGRELGDHLPPAAIAGLREIDHLRPQLLVPAFLEGLLERTISDFGLRSKIKRLWDRLADEVLSLAFVREGGQHVQGNLHDGLAKALRFGQRPSSGWAAGTCQWLRELRGAGDDSYLRHALAEPEFRNRRARQIVYGHTHASECIPLDASSADGYVLNQMYFNAGTFRRTYRPTHANAGSCEFIPCDNVHLLAFYQGDERQGRSFETWSGMLGANPLDVTPPRIDPATGSMIGAGARSALPPGAIRAPHFATAGVRV